jgi:hypothetical protein
VIRDGFMGGVLQGSRSAIIIPALIALPLAPLYLLSTDLLWIALGFVAQISAPAAASMGRWCRI